MMRNGKLMLMGFLLVVPVLFAGTDPYQEANANEYKRQLVNLCDLDIECETAIVRNFDDCFGSHYDSAALRGEGQLRVKEFTECIHGKSGKVFFRLRSQGMD